MFKKAALTAIVLGGMSTSVLAANLEIKNGHRMNDSLPYPNSAQNLTLGLWCGYEDVEISNNWKKAFKEAAVNITNSVENVGLRWLDECNYVDINVFVYDGDWSSGNWFTSIVADAELGSSNGVGSYIRLNPSYDGFGHPSTHAFKVHTAMHEILHTLGLNHTYTTEGLEVPGTDNSNEVLQDSTTILLPSDKSKVTVLSKLDIKALNYIYNR